MQGDTGVAGYRKTCGGQEDNMAMGGGKGERRVLGCQQCPLSRVEGSLEGFLKGREPKALPGTHSPSPHRFCLYPGLHEDLVGTHPPGAHSLVAVSVGEMGERGSGGPCWCLMPAPHPRPGQRRLRHHRQLPYSWQGQRLLFVPTHPELGGTELPITVLIGQPGLGASQNCL